MKRIEKLRMELSDQWIPAMYRAKVRSARTRSFQMDIPERENSPDILHTLLGIELKVGNLRLACPDLATARYLRVFARLGCTKIAVPYDISKISEIADKLDTAWHRINLLLENESTRNRNKMLRDLRNEIREIGAGEAMPEFNQNTRQRNR
jgi:hypothetical protein